jgi:type IV pilus assembly protein PilE
MNSLHSTQGSKTAQRRRGFTLIELLISIAIVAILASIALPNFLGSIRKSRRSEAVAALNNVQQAQERFRANQTTYTTNLTAAMTASTPGLGLSASTPNGYYTIAVGSASATSYEATATAVSGSSQANDGTCAKLGVKVTGASLEFASGGVGDTLSYAASNKCWSR